MMKTRSSVWTWILVAVACGAASGVGAANSAGSLEIHDLEQDASLVPETFLGFRPGEELRYTLESTGGEDSRTHTAWTIRLEEIEGDLGAFELSYEVGRISGFAESRQGEFITLMARTLATAWVNAYGFPTRVRFTTQRNTARGGLEYTIEYRYEDERIVKRVEGFSGEQKEKLDDHDGVVNRMAPSGMFLFMPAEAECVGMARQMVEATSGTGQPGGGQPQGGLPPGGMPPGAQPSGGAPAMSSMRAQPPDIEQPCRGREPVFANPGLLNLAMPALWEAGTGNIELLAFAPTGLDLAALMASAQGSGGSGFTVGGIPIFGGGGPNPFGDPEDAFQSFALTADSELLQIEVGGRAVDAFRLNAPAPLEAVYVDGNGSIVRLDLLVDPETGEHLRIRRLRASEY
jgi:hypothetical protein